MKRSHLPAGALLPLLALLSACATHPRPGPERVTIVTVHDQVAVPCASATKVQKPAFADTVVAIAAVPSGGIVALAKLYAESRQQHYAYEAALEAADAGCAKP